MCSSARVALVLRAHLHARFHNVERVSRNGAESADERAGHERMHRTDLHKWELPRNIGQTQPSHRIQACNVPPGGRQLTTCNMQYIICDRHDRQRATDNRQKTACTRQHASCNAQRTTCNIQCRVARSATQPSFGASTTVQQCDVAAAERVRSLVDNCAAVVVCVRVCVLCRTCGCDEPALAASEAFTTSYSQKRVPTDIACKRRCIGRSA